MALTDETTVNSASDATASDGVEPSGEDLSPKSTGSADPRDTALFRRFNSDPLRVPGALIADGRFRLLVFHGGPPHLQFWQAIDTALGRQVALTLVGPDGALPAEDVDEIIWQTARLRGLETRGIAPVLHVVRTGRGGVVVSEWIRGGTLQEVAGTAPAPIGVAEAMQSLAEAARAAHRTGIALSIDHPDRIRVSTEGAAVLAFPATMPDATAQGDLRGIGGALHALLVNRWPLQEQGAPNGWACAELDPDGRPEQPAVLDTEIPFLISAAAAGLVRGRDGIRSAATVLTLLRQATEEAGQGEAESLVREQPALPPPGGYADFRNFGPAEQAQAARRQLLRAWLATGAAVIVLVLMLLASTFNRIIASGDAGVTQSTDKLGLHPASSPPPQAAPPATVGGGPVKPVQAVVFSPGGAADSPASAGLAIDGDPATAWSTDTYFDAVPFPKFKDGVGLLLQLPQPVALSAVTVDLDSTGTVVQLRSSTSATPAKLTDTTELTSPTPLQPGHNSIPLNSPAPVSNVLVWISTLGSTGRKSHSDIAEITLQGAPPRA